MGHRPYPDADRALAQLERHHPRQVVTIHADTSALEAAFARLRSIEPPASRLVHPLALSAVGRAIAQAGADAEATRERAAAAGPPQCHGCGHALHAPGIECEAGVDHGPKRWHRCLCLATPGASRPCPPVMDCQGGTLGYSDVWHLRQGRSLRGVNGETITPDVLAEPQSDEAEAEKLAKARRMAKALSAPPVAPPEWAATTEWPGRHKRPSDRRVHATARFVVNDMQRFWTACGEPVGRGGTSLAHMPVDCRACQRRTAAGVRQDGSQPS